MLGDFARSAAHQILCVAVHRECDDLADVLLVAQQHNHAVNARCHACMRRCTKLEGIVQRAELLLEIFFGVTGNLKCLDHDFQIVVTNRTGGQLHAVADNIVLICQNFGRILGVQRFQTALRHGERVVGEDNLLFFLVKLEHREVVDKAEAICVLLEQIQTSAQLVAQLAGIVCSLALAVSDKEDGVASFQTSQLGNFRLHVVRNEFVDRALVGHVVLYLQVAQTAHADGLCILQQLLMEALGHVRVNLDGANRLADERLKGAAREELGQVDDAQRVAQIRLVGTELQHSLLVADNRIRSSCDSGTFRRKLLKRSGENFFACAENIFLRSKAHLKVQLIELARGTVSACVLIAEARSDLEVLVKAGNHQQLLVLLRRLRQRVELALELTGRNHVVTRTLWRRSTQNRGLDFQKAHVCHLLTQERDNLRAEYNVVFDLLVAQVEVTILQTDILADFLRGLNFERQLTVNLAQHGNRVCLQLDGAGRNLRVVGFLVAVLNRAFNRDAVLLVDALEQGGVAHDNLHGAVHVAQVDEGYTAVVTDVFYPACDAQGGADICFRDDIHCLVAINIGCVHGLNSFHMIDFSGKKHKKTARPKQLVQDEQRTVRGTT